MNAILRPDTNSNGVVDAWMVQELVKPVLQKKRYLPGNGLSVNIESVLIKVCRAFHPTQPKPKKPISVVQLFIGENNYVVCACSLRVRARLGLRGRHSA